MTFTPSQNAVCQVSLDGSIETGNGGAGDAYGVAEHTSAGDEQADDSNVLTTPGDYAGTGGGSENAASLSRSRIIPVQAGTTYTFEMWIEPTFVGANGGGTASFNMDYVCFAT